MRRLALWLVASSVAYAARAAATGADTGAWFKEEARERGLRFRHVSGDEGRYEFPHIVGGGAALVDVDGDDDLDIYLVQSGALSEDGAANQLYFNDGSGHFVLAKDAGSAADRRYGMGVAAGDYDNDGDVDLYVTNFGDNVLLQNDGKGRFVDVSATAGVAHGGWGTAALFNDLDRDGDLDLFLVNYVNWTPNIEQSCFHTNLDVRDYCPPNNYKAPAMDVLYRNNGDGTFTDVTREAGIRASFGNGLGAVSADFDGNGLIDVFVANDTMMNQLWLNQGNLRFVDEALLWGSAVDENGIEKAGMGIVAGDPDSDGDMDVMVVNLTGQADSYFQNEGQYFIDATAAIGLSVPSKRYTRFGVILADFDNDGWLDIYHANGGVLIDPDSGHEDPYAEPNVLMKGLRGVRFEEVVPQGGTTVPLVFTSRGTAVGDLNNDGALDLLVVNRDAEPSLLINQNSTRGNHLAFAVRAGGRDAHGAMVSARVGARTLRRVVQPDGSYLAGNDPRVHFGLGNAARALDVTVRWPDGSEERFGDYEAGRRGVLTKGTGRTVPPRLGARSGTEE